MDKPDLVVRQDDPEKDEVISGFEEAKAFAKSLNGSQWQSH
jgi:hypothetical protein